MKKTISALFLLLLSTTIFAHTPFIEAYFDIENQKLEITVNHNVYDESTHFIKEINVKLNDKLIIIQYFKSQSDKIKQVVEYTIIDAKVGDSITVEAKCNEFRKNDLKINI